MTTTLITGATDGLGKGVAIELARRGATVLVHGRDQARIDSAVAEIRERTGNERSRGYLADLSSLAAVVGLAEQVRAREPRLDVLINNAGIGRGPSGRQYRQESADGYELRFAVNYLAPFLLSQRLLTLLRESAPARIVNVASVGQAPLDFDDVMLTRSYDPGRAYSQSKLALIMFTFEMARRLAAEDARVVTVNSLHPATLMPTKIVTESWTYTVDTLQDGIDAVVRLAVHPALEGISGRYFAGTEESEAHVQAYDLAARHRLWELTTRLVDAVSEPADA